MNGFLANSAHKIYCSPLFPSSLRIISSGRCITAQHHSKLKKMNLRRYLCNGLNYFPNCQNFEGLFFANKKHWSKFLIILTIKTRRNFKKKVSSRKRQGGNRGGTVQKRRKIFLSHLFFCFLAHNNLSFSFNNPKWIHFFFVLTELPVPEWGEMTPSFCKLLPVPFIPVITCCFPVYGIFLGQCRNRWIFSKGNVCSQRFLCLFWISRQHFTCGC